MEKATLFYKSKLFWEYHGFEVIEPNMLEKHPSPSAFSLYGIIRYEPNEVRRINDDIPLSKEVIRIFNYFHSKYPIEEWENYQEICDINEKMKELF